MTDAIPETMTAIAISQPGGPDVLQPVRLATPTPGAGEVLIKVAAAGVNRPDVFQRQGHYPPPPDAPETPGLEVAGTIAACGDETSGFSVGDAVCALVAGGGYAEYCVAPAPQVLPLPTGLSMIEAAGVPETFFTVWTNLFDRAALKAGDSVLIHGGASGIGTTAIMLARAWGAEVYATAGSDEKCRFIENLGASRAINYKTEDFVASIREVTAQKGVDVILDMVGGDYIARNFEALAVEGRLVQIAFIGGARATVDFRPLMVKRLTFTGSTLRPRPIAEKGRIANALKQQVWPLIETGTVKPIIDSEFPLADAAEAHRRIDSSAHIGKIILTID